MKCVTIRARYARRFMHTSTALWVPRRDAKQATQPIDGRKTGGRLSGRARASACRHFPGQLGYTAAVAAVAEDRPNAGRPVLDPIGTVQSDHASANQGFLEPVPFRRRQAMAALSVLPATRGAVVQRIGRLLLSRLRR